MVRMGEQNIGIIVRIWELEGERVCPGRKGEDVGSNEAGGAEEKTPSVSWLCVEVQDFLLGEVRESGRRSDV